MKARIDSLSKSGTGYTLHAMALGYEGFAKLPITKEQFESLQVGDEIMVSFSVGVGLKQPDHPAATVGVGADEYEYTGDLSAGEHIHE